MAPCVQHTKSKSQQGDAPAPPQLLLLLRVERVNKFKAKLMTGHRHRQAHITTHAHTLTCIHTHVSSYDIAALSSSSSSSSSFTLSTWQTVELTLKQPLPLAAFLPSASHYTLPVCHYTPLAFPLLLLSSSAAAVSQFLQNLD